MPVLGNSEPGDIITVAADVERPVEMRALRTVHFNVASHYSDIPLYAGQTTILRETARVAPQDPHVGPVVEVSGAAWDDQPRSADGRFIEEEAAS